MKRKLLATILSLALVLTMLPLGVSAASDLTVVIDNTTPTVGQKLTASVNGAEGSLSYTWSGEGVVDSATNEYTVTADSIGKTITVNVSSDSDTFANGGNTATTSVVQAKAITSISISGTPTVGTALAYTTDPVGATGTITWTVGGIGQGESYTPVAADIGKDVYVSIAGSGDYSDETAASDQTGTKVAPKPLPAISISGTAKVGETLSVTGLPATTVSYQWKSDGVPVGADATYIVAAADIGKVITVTVTGTAEDDYKTATATSAGTSAVSAKSITSVNINSDAPMVGTQLTATVEPGDATVTYSWKVNGAEKGTGETYTPSEDDLGYAVQLDITGTGDYNGATATDTTAAVVNQTITAVTIPANPKVGDVLTVTSTPAGATFACVWSSDDGSLAGATTGDTYTVLAGDAGKTIKVTITGTGNYVATSLASNTSSAVVYKRTAGGGSVVKGSALSFTFNTEASPAGEVTISVDGFQIDSENYTVAAGSTIITLKSAYLSTLSAGQHTLTGTLDNVAFESQSFTVSAPTPTAPAATPTSASGRANPSTGVK